MRVVRKWYPPGDLGTALVVWHMRHYAHYGATDPLVRKTATDIVAEVPGRDAEGQIELLREWIADNLRFQRDSSGSELLHTPKVMLARLLTEGPPLAIDCDDAAMLAAALGKAVGLKARFVLVGFLSPHSPFRHVWTELSPPSGLNRGRWQEMDVTRLDQSVPVENISRKWIVGV